MFLLKAQTVGNSVKKKLNDRVVLAVSEVLAMRHIAKTFDIEISLAEDWYYHQRDSVDPTICKDAQPQHRNLQKYHGFVQKLIEENPDIRMGEIAERLVDRILSPKPIQQSQSLSTKKPLDTDGRRQTIEANDDIGPTLPQTATR
jgi:hypothetical protein